jgi:hypothetical protein
MEDNLFREFGKSTGSGFSLSGAGQAGGGEWKEGQEGEVGDVSLFARNMVTINAISRAT